MSPTAATRILNPSTPTPRPFATLSMIAADVLTLEVALALGCLTRLLVYPFFPIGLGLKQFAGPAAGILLLPMVYYWAGLYPGYGLGAVHRLRARVWATAMIFAALQLWNYLFVDREWSRGVLGSTMIFALILPPVVQTLLRKFARPRGLFGVPAIVLGAGAVGAILTERLKNDEEIDLVPVAVLDEDPEKWGTKLHGVPITGPISSNVEFEGIAKVALVAMPELDRAGLVRLVQSLAFPHVIVVPDLSGLQTLWTSSRDLGGVLGLEVRNNLLIGRNRLIKRMLDCVLASVLLLFAAPVVAICALLVKIVSPGPAFFRQEREGADGEKFMVWKLRTMRPDAERLLDEHLASHPSDREMWRTRYKLNRDPRVLPVIGRFLRRSSLDEFPQLWGVLTGAMSLVGPRPFPQYHLRSFSREFRELRRSVTPGLTGLWQVSSRSDGDLAVQERQDTYYIRNWSLWLDLYILLRTVRIVLLAKGAY
jgi:Undecaprenyl-phosphate galactose phosphotransferase WbaP